ncbi:uncharacterized protein METZ01_LOCUS454353, partial [marine metagenome]
MQYIKRLNFIKYSFREYANSLINLPILTSDLHPDVTRTKHLVQHRELIILNRKNSMKLVANEFCHHR